MTRRTRRLSVALTISLVAGMLSFGTFASPASAATQLTTNSCQNTATGTFGNIDFTYTGAATPNPATLGVDTVTLSGATLSANFPSAVLVNGYNLGLLGSVPAGGGSVTVTVPGTMTPTLLGSNTAEVTQTVAPITIAGTTTITDPNGIKGDGDESATPLTVTVTVPPTTWTPTGGDIGLSDGGSVTVASVAGGLVNVTFTCLPGDSVNTTLPVPSSCQTDPASDCTSRVQVPAVPFDTVVVNAPPTAPVCSGSAVSVGAGQATTVDLSTLCNDVNGNMDLTTAAVGATAPTAGTVAFAGGIATYTNTNVLATSDSFSYTVADTTAPTPLVSTEVTVTITILGNLCDATTAACSLNQIITVTVTGAALTLEQTGQFVTMSPVTLNGAPQVSTGAINQMTVTNSRGDLVGWTVSGYVTDLATSAGPHTDPDGPGPLPPVPDCGFLVGTADALCIPGDDLGWTPSATVAHVQINGDVAAVTAGPSHATSGADWLAQLVAAGPAGVNGLGGLAENNVLCSAAAGTDGGTFTCDAALYLGVPASAGAGTYSGALVLTLL